MSETTSNQPAGSTLDTRIFAVAADDDATGTGRFARWLNAENLGFHDPRVEEDDIPAYIEAFSADQRVMWGVHDPAVAEHSLGVDAPVATYGSMVNGLNVGGGSILDAHLITAVTVQASHRRRGILRGMMTRDLTEAAGRGLAVAALTASEATIYGRFGFGCATFEHAVEVDVRERFAITAPQAGHTALVSPEHGIALSADIFRRFHARTPGSVGRQFAYPRRASGRWGRERPVEDKAVRMAVHYDDDGTPAGYVSYRFSGWDTTPYTMKIVDLVASTESAYLELWRYLGDLDLVQRVTWGGAPESDPLPWALRDRRCYRLTGTEDVLWVRILDVVAALEARPYRGDGRLVLEVTDAMGLVGGSYVLTVVDGTADVEPVAAGAAPDAMLDAAALGSIYLGGVAPSVLAAAGRLTAHADDAVVLLDRLFRAPVSPYCITHF
ncbi:GNAT family N-acetyltransferase [Arthrobacter sp. H41]|uniref:GNAT family N-acetyltransferase n=1 Tax=Arthrobacter sp. H41 TaxID=1312978 RepID=UPI0004B7C0EE|nr:GNAT family N-acetyltransferase [Arthrobacter sp. H41]